MSAFFIKTTEVTQAEWLRVFGRNPSMFTQANGYAATLDAVTDPTGGPQVGGTFAPRVIRGGGWNDPVVDVRAAERFEVQPQGRRADVGFRPARSATSDGQGQGAAPRVSASAAASST